MIELQVSSPVHRAGVEDRMKLILKIYGMVDRWNSYIHSEPLQTDIFSSADNTLCVRIEVFLT